MYNFIQTLELNDKLIEVKIYITNLDCGLKSFEIYVKIVTQNIYIGPKSIRSELICLTKNDTLKLSSNFMVQLKPFLLCK